VQYNIPQDSLDYQILNQLQIMKLTGDLSEYTVGWPTDDSVYIDFIAADGESYVVSWRFDHLVVEKEAPQVPHYTLIGNSEDMHRQLADIEATDDYERAMRGI